MVFISSTDHIEINNLSERGLIIHSTGNVSVDLSFSGLATDHFTHKYRRRDVQTIPQRAGVAAGFCSNQSRAHSLTNQLSED